jgi:hypothetical protein
MIPSSNGSVLVESPTGRGGVHVDVDGARTDLYFRADPASRTPIFSTSLIGRTRSGERHPLVAFDHSRTADGRYTSTSRIDGFDVQNAAVEFRNQDQVLQRTPLSQIPLSSGGMMSSDWPTSFHYETETLEDGQSITVIAWDYEVESDSTAGGSSLSYDGNATVWPEGTDGAPLTVTHVALVLKSAALPANAIEGVSLTGASRLALLNGRSASSDR